MCWWHRPRTGSGSPEAGLTQRRLERRTLQGRSRKRRRGLMTQALGARSRMRRTGLRTQALRARSRMKRREEPGRR